ncbi:oxidoreductase (plasmid) [Paracoccus liaowanqingii]|uniref:Oxidoreductase n=1 Tax=Paracoccus liaowanqingii TaxID=2560053 RepID=A0A4Y5SU05_9RHOB|nr:FAD-dependent oxidoreductase [Paracoccus liaowanqingii]QDA36255.1 oxidoreductase [Paracoccus liaowanqingii]
MSLGGTLIIGAGQGGLQLAVSLRQAGYAGPVTLVGAEHGLPYQRPPLSKAYLLDGRAEALTLRPASFFTGKDVTCLPGHLAEAIDRDARTVTLRHDGGLRILPYDHLVLATGARNLTPPIAGAERALGLRSLSDAQILRDRLPQARRVAVIGGGFIGLEFAAVARKLGLEVAVIEAAPRLLSRAVSGPMAATLAAWHQAQGVALHLGQGAVAVDDAGVTLSDGSHILADLVLMAAGVRPDTALAEAAGLEVADGVRLDGQLRSSDPAISALGDCASAPCARTGRHLRLESVQAATDQARLIAARIAGAAPADYTALPWFWSDQGACKLQIAGHAGLGARDEALSADTVARFDDHGLAAIETLNNPRAHMAARRHLSAPDPDVDLFLNSLIAA